MPAMLRRRGGVIMVGAVENVRIAGFAAQSA